MAYPQYQVTFAGTGVPNGSLTVNGSHTFEWTAEAAKFEVALTTNDATDPIPRLTITFADLTPDPTDG